MRADIITEMENFKATLNYLKTSALVELRLGDHINSLALALVTNSNIFGSSVFM
jgi:hypothetical protein